MDHWVNDPLLQSLRPLLLLRSARNDGVRCVKLYFLRSLLSATSARNNRCVLYKLHRIVINEIFSTEILQRP